MSLPLAFNWENLLILIISGFAVINVAAAGIIAIHRSNLGHAKYMITVCLLWAIVEAVQLFVNGFAMSGQQSNFQSSYLLLAAVTSTLSLYMPISLILHKGFSFKNFIVYLIPLILLCCFYTYVWYGDTAQSATCYEFPDIWHNEFSWDLIFCIVCFAYIITNTIYVIVMIRGFIRPLQDFLLESGYDPFGGRKFINDICYLVYAILGFFILYLSQGTVEFALAYKLVLIVAIPIIFTTYLLIFENYPMLKDFHKYYNTKWDAATLSWVVTPTDRSIVTAKIGSAENSEDEASDDSLSETEINSYRERLEAWMESKKPYLNKNFKVSDVYEFLEIDRYSCSEFFAKAYNCYFRAWASHYRIDHAIDLLKKEPDKQLKAVAHESGFSSQAVFARTFYNIMGMSCTEYKKKFLS